MQEFVILALVMLLGLGAYWSMVVFPKQRDFQKKQQLVRTLAVGDEVVTYGGVIGRVISIEPEQGLAYIEIADGVVIRIIAAALMQHYDPATFAQAAQMGIDEKGAAGAE